MRDLHEHASTGESDGEHRKGKVAIARHLLRQDGVIEREEFVAIIVQLLKAEMQTSSFFRKRRVGSRPTIWASVWRCLEGMTWLDGC